VRKYGWILGVLVVTGCAPAPVKQGPPLDDTKEAWYGRTVEQLAGMNRDASRAFEAGKQDEASALIQSADPLVKRLLAVPRPTLAATEAAADVDDLYGRMLLANRHYGWARLMFQKNLARWKYWRPQTAETAVRYKRAEAAIAECDRHLSP
jgi:hypothetical protein